MSQNRKRVTAICGALLLYAVAISFFQIGEAVEAAQAAQRQESGIYLHTVGLTKWDFFGLGLIGITTVGLFVALSFIGRVKVGSKSPLSIVD